MTEAKPWCEPSRRAFDGKWILWRNMTDIELGLVTEEDLEGVPPHRRWIPVAVETHKRDLPDLRKKIEAEP